MKIKVKLYNGQILPKFINEGDWVDIYTTGEISLKGPVANTLKRTRKNHQDVSVRDVEFYPQFTSLNMAMELPAGYEAHILARSSTFKKYGFVLSNTQGIIDNSFNGNEDIWGAHMIPFRDAVIPAGKAFLQFRIMLSQKASLWQRIKWLFSSGKIEFVQVEDLKNNNRGGWGSTDDKKNVL